MIFHPKLKRHNLLFFLFIFWNSTDWIPFHFYKDPEVKVQLIFSIGQLILNDTYYIYCKLQDC